jgi:CHASE3 domain sensor protein
MKKTLIGPILTGLVLLVIAAMFVYFYLQLNRLEKKTIALQTTIVNDTEQVNAVINFLNSNLNAQTNQQ